MINRIHVNQHVIRANGKTGDRNPVLTAKSSKGNQKGNLIQILDKSGEIVACVVYSPDKPLPCGAKVWIETTNPIEIY